MHVGAWGLRSTLSLLIAACCLFPSAARADDDDNLSLLNPLPVRDQFLLNNGFYFFEPEGARVLPAESWVETFSLADADAPVRLGGLLLKENEDILLEKWHARFGS